MHYGYNTYYPGCSGNRPAYILVSSEADLPLDLNFLRDYLKIDNTSEDDLLTAFLQTATKCFEDITNRTVITKTYKVLLDCWFYCFEIKKSVLQEILSVTYFDADGVEQTVDSSDYYVTESATYSKLVFIDGFEFPALRGRLQDITINFKVGYGDDACSIPNDIKTALMAHVAAMYFNRGDCIDDTCSNLLPPQAACVYNKYEIIEITV
jgi:uncharacterized phiE125 gp8 family phage protein